MNILVLEHITKRYGDKELFHDISLGINEGEKIGIIGINGTGKSTLLKLIAGLEESDDGTITKGRNVRIGWLPQNPEISAPTILEAASEGDPEREVAARTMLFRLGFTDLTRPTEHLSGGERKRVALARTLLEPVDVLILDEPTNHLDSEMVRWLEDYLDSWKGVLIMVTHDRYFLDRVTNRILEIDHGSLYSYETNYSGYLEKREERIRTSLAADQKRANILRTELAWLRRGARARSTKQKAHIQRIEALQDVRNTELDGTVAIDSLASRMGKKTIEIRDVSKHFGDQTLFEGFSYIVLKGDRIGIIGPNGCGKSTLMKIITGQLAPDSGEVITGETIRIGYFAQENEDMDTDTRVIDYIRDVAEIIRTAQGTATASQMLERFLFPPALQYTPVRLLSGGEKRRLYLLRVLMSAPNVLILDEPTNDLDIATLTTLEDYLDSFDGIVITVSHDRYFLDRMVRRIFAFEGTAITQYEGGYTDYFLSPRRPDSDMSSGSASQKSRKKGVSASESTGPKGRKETSAISENTGSRGRNEKSAASEYAKARGRKEDSSAMESTSAAEARKNVGRSHAKKLKFTYREQQEYNTIDDDIAALEERIAAIDSEMETCASQYARLNELMEEKEKLSAELEAKMDRWVYLNDLAEQIEAQGKT